MAKTKNILEPKQSDFNLKSIKILNGGGLYVEYNYQFSSHNESHTIDAKISNSANVHDDLWALLKKQKPNVLTVEEINYRMMATTLEKMGIDNQKEVSQVVEGMQQDALQKIEITGIKISGKDEKKQSVITYKKITGNKKIAGRATTLIQLSGSVYGFEQELESDLEEITTEVYAYLFEGKFGDSDQQELNFGEVVEEKEEPEEE